MSGMPREKAEPLSFAGYLIRIIIAGVAVSLKKSEQINSQIPSARQPSFRIARQRGTSPRRRRTHPPAPAPAPAPTHTPAHTPTPTTDFLYNLAHCWKSRKAPTPTRARAPTPTTDCFRRRNLVDLCWSSRKAPTPTPTPASTLTPPTDYFCLNLLRCWSGQES